MCLAHVFAVASVCMGLAWFCWKKMTSTQTRKQFEVIQVLIGRNDKFSLDESALRSVLCSREVESQPVAIISMVGSRMWAFQTLASSVSYLRLIRGQTGKGVGLPELDSFPSNERGVFIWNEPFFSLNSDKEPVVLLAVTVGNPPIPSQATVLTSLLSYSAVCEINTDTKLLKNINKWGYANDSPETSVQRLVTFEIRDAAVERLGPKHVKSETLEELVFSIPSITDPQENQSIRRRSELLNPELLNVLYNHMEGNFNKVKGTLSTGKRLFEFARGSYEKLKVEIFKGPPKSSQIPYLQSDSDDRNIDDFEELEAPEVLPAGSPGEDKTVALLEEVDGKLVLNEAGLERLLDPGKLKNLPIAVISIAGAFRMGKSFILNLFLRYFRTKGWKSVNRSWLKDWKSSEDDGIRWQGGTKGHTRGIVAWSEPFIVERANGSKLAVILLDTQGNFDHGRSKEENIGIFALSTLFSSFQIFNISKQIQTNDLDYLQCFVEFSKLAQPKKSSNVDSGAVSHQRCFFQDILFLVRDWQNPGSHPYGIVGGDDYLKTTSCPPSDVHAHKYLSDTFNRIQCYLMPEPSDKVRITGSERQILRSLDLGEKFFEHVTDLVAECIHPDMLRPKSLGFAGKVTADVLLHHIKCCANNILSGERPEFPSLMRLIATNANVKALEKLEKHYKAETEKAIKSMENPTWDEFDKMLEIENTKARIAFKERTLYARKKNRDDDLKNLNHRIESTFLTIKMQMEKRRCSFIQERIKIWMNESRRELKVRQVPYTDLEQLKKIPEQRFVELPLKHDRDPYTIILYLQRAKDQLNAFCEKNVRAASIQNRRMTAVGVGAAITGIVVGGPIAAAGYILSEVVIGGALALTAGTVAASAAVKAKRVRDYFLSFVSGDDPEKEKTD